MPHPRIEQLLRATAWYCDGPPIGVVTGVFVDLDDERPRWASVAPGRLIPLCRTAVVDGRLVVVLPLGAVEAAPPLPADAVHVRADLEDALYAHYADVLAPVTAAGLRSRPAAPGGGPVTARRVTAVAPAPPTGLRRP